MIYDYFSHYAKATPDAPAIIDGTGIQNSYLEAFQYLNALMVVLGTECPKLDQQQPVGVACESRRLHLLLLFALEALGIATIIYVQPIDAGLVDTVPLCGLFIGEHRPVNARAFFRLDKSFFDKVAQAMSQALAVPAKWGPDQVVRLVTTSGSTGRSKVMPLTYRTQTVRVERRVRLYGMSANTRLLLPMVVTAPLLLNVQAALSQGGTAVFSDAARLTEQLAIATDVLLLPIHLSDLLKALPPGYRPVAPLKIFCTGAELAPVLRQSAMTRLGATIVCPYGTNEAGSIASFDEHGLGTIFPDVEVEVVDENMQLLPFGSEGHIRTRSEEMVAGYLDPVLTREHFVDGWFLPGDLGLMPQPGQLRLTGRAQGLLNFGGVKYAPELIEQLLAQFVQADDVAVCSSTNDEGIDELQIAVVNSRLDDKTLAEGVLARIGKNFAAIHLHRARSIPRNAAGKVQRQLLGEWLNQRQGKAH